MSEAYYDCEVFFPREMDSLMEAESWAAERSAFWHQKVKTNLNAGGQYSTLVSWNRGRFSETVAVLREINPGEYIVVSIQRMTAGSMENPFTPLRTKQVLILKPS